MSLIKLVKTIEISIRTYKNTMEKSIYTSILPIKHLSRYKKPDVDAIDFKKEDPVPIHIQFAKNPLPNLNEHITLELEKLLEIHNDLNNTYNAIAYKRAITVIKGFTEKIVSYEQVKGLRHIGNSILQKIEEILETGHISKIDLLQNEEKNQSLIVFLRIWGVGLSVAHKLYRKGLRTIEDVRENESMLNHQQQIGLKYYEDLLVKIPRDEVTEIFEYIKTCLKEIYPGDIIEAEVCGSYRRKKKLCSDIDVLITRKDYGKVEDVLDLLLEKLTETGFIKDTLSLSKSFKQDHMKNQFFGICKLKEQLPNRRIDIKVI